jgi:predicted ATPase
VVGSLSVVGDDRWFSDPLPIRRVQGTQDVTADVGTWPWSLPPVAQLLRDGLDLGRATILVGENGTGKSTLVEAVAMAYGLNAEGGSTGAQHRTLASESELHTALTLHRGAGASRWGYFLRAETMHGLFTYLDTSREDSTHTQDPYFHPLSHGQSFVAMLGTSRFSGRGLFVMDEPEAGLSFSAQLALLGELGTLRDRAGTQILLATHSPVVASLPGATILELDDDGYHRSSWDELALVDHHRRFLHRPDSYLRHLISPEDDD